MKSLTLVERIEWWNVEESTDDTIDSIENEREHDESDEYDIGGDAQREDSVHRGDQETTPIDNVVQTQ